jgi:hypothetical protein
VVCTSGIHIAHALDHLSKEFEHFDFRNALIDEFCKCSSVAVFEKEKSILVFLDYSIEAHDVGMVKGRQ